MRKLKRIIVVYILVLLFLVGCAQKPVKIVDQTKNKDPSSDVVEDAKTDVIIKKMSLNPASFQYIADWLTDSKIVFVEKVEASYDVKTFDIVTGSIDTIYSEDTIIADVLIHPTKKKILLHTTNDTSSAVVKIVSLQGKVLDEIEIASTELAIEWNQLDHNLVLLTAFYEDWSYDVFLYNGTAGEFDMISMEDPFPKWVGNQKIAIIHNEDLSVEGADLLIYDTVTKETELSALGKVIYFDTYEDSILTAQVSDDENALFTLSEETGTVLSSWKMPVASNFDEWVIPDISWLSQSELVTLTLSKAEMLDGVDESSYELVIINGSKIDVLAKDVPVGPLRCSPDKGKCLYGQNKESLIDLKNKNIVDWLESK